MLVLLLGTARCDAAAGACGDGDADVPLTQAYYLAIGTGEKKASDVTCIPDNVFEGFAGAVTLGPMPALASIGESAFSSMQGVLTLEAGDCPQLTTIG